MSRTLLSLALAPLAVATLIKDYPLDSSITANLVRRRPNFHLGVDRHDMYIKDTSQSPRAPPEDILQWVAKNGATISDSIAVSSQGLTTKKEAVAGTVLLSVPANLTIQSDTAAGSRLEKLLQDEKIPLVGFNAESHELRLAAALLVLSRGGHEALSGYVKRLPTPAQNRDLNLFMAKKELLASFQDLPIAPRVLEYQISSNKRLEQFQSLGGRADASDWEWADSLVKQNAFRRERHGSLMLVPAVDRVVTTMDASKQTVEINIGDKSGPIQVVAKQHLYPGMDLLGPLRGSEIMRDETVSLRGDAGACSRLSEAVANIMKSYTVSGDCLKSPAQVSQKAAFCNLAGMAASGCSECTAFPCKNNACSCGDNSFATRFFATIKFDFWGASAERPLLVSCCVFLGVVLVVVRSFRLLDSTKPRSRRSLGSQSSSTSQASGDSDDNGVKKGQNRVSKVKFAEGGLNLGNDGY
jgi:hypothetical protein